MNTKTVLAIGFSIVIMVTIILAFIGASILHASTQRIDTIVHTNNLKHNLIMRMRAAARERIGHLQKMIIIDDPFDRDEEWMSYNAQGAEFIGAYQELKKMELGPKEQVLLANEEKSINETGPCSKGCPSRVQGGSAMTAHRHRYLDDNMQHGLV